MTFTDFWRGSRSKLLTMSCFVLKGKAWTWAACIWRIDERKLWDGRGRKPCGILVTLFYYTEERAAVRPNWFWRRLPLLPLNLRRFACFDTNINWLILLRWCVPATRGRATERHINPLQCWPILRRRVLDFKGPSQWPSARTLGLWARIPLEPWMSIFVYSVFVLFCE
jgi:hypothetical protein